MKSGDFLSLFISSLLLTVVALTYCIVVLQSFLSAVVQNVSNCCKLLRTKLKQNRKKRQELKLSCEYEKADLFLSIKACKPPLVAK